VEGLLAWRTNADGTREEWSYDPEGNPLTHTDAGGATTRFEVTQFDLVLARTGPDGGGSPLATTLS
jgi:YD repeat-containing protein